MKHLLKNPFIVGAAGGAVATGIHFVNRKIVKKEEKIEMIDLAKVFILVAVLVGGGMFVVNKKKLLPSKMLSGSTAPTSVPPVMTGGGNVPVRPQVMSQPATVNTNPVRPPTNPGVMNGNQTISNMPTVPPPTLEISDINDVIHTGTPNF